MYAIVGVSGHTGSVVADTLLARGKAVRAIVRDAAKGGPWKVRGADVVVADLDDSAALTRAFTGAEGAYVLLPPDPASADLLAVNAKRTASIAAAVSASGVPHVVLLSAFGAQHADGTGPIRGVHAAERQLAATGAGFTALRAAYLHENWGAALRTLDSGTIFTFVPTDLRFPQVATVDVGRTAAAALVEGVPRGQTRVIELAGPSELSGDDVGRALSAILGKPIKVEAAALDAVVPTLTRFGLSQELAELLREEYAGIISGRVAWEGGKARALRGSATIDETLKKLLSHATVWRPLAAADAAAAAAARTAAAPTKGQLRGVAARPGYDGILSQVPAPPHVRYEAETVGGIAGWWCVPEGAKAGSAILYLHGGWFHWGTSFAYRHFAGHVAAAARCAAFVPDYRLAPEHPFPAGAEDALRCFDGLAERGRREISLASDSAGGNLALGLAARLAVRPGLKPARVVALSPVTDLSLASPSWDTRAEADPYFTRAQAGELVSAYLAGHAATDPLASPLHGAAAGLPPLRVHVGEDEVLLDDSLRYVERAAAAGVDARVDVWRGMPHVFLTGIEHFAAARLALAEIGAFLAG